MRWVTRYEITCGRVVGGEWEVEWSKRLLYASVHRRPRYVGRVRTWLRTWSYIVSSIRDGVFVRV